MRIKIHEPYFAIPAYQTLAKKSDAEMADLLDMSVRSYKEKIVGFSDFSAKQGKIMSAVFGVSQDEIFAT